MIQCTKSICSPLAGTIGYVATVYVTINEVI